MGCKTCRSECGREDGCGSRKAVQKELLDGLLARLYPSHCWGQPEALASLQDGLDLQEVVQLASWLATALRVPAYVVPGGEDDHCNFIYALCFGREPALVELREAPPPAWAWDQQGPSVRDRYLRIACSTLGRLACVQEVAMELFTQSSDCPTNMVAVRESSLPGVFDPVLLKRFQRTVDLLAAHGVEHLDMGLLDVDAEAFGLLPGDYLSRFGAAPALLNYLFYATPVKTTAVTFLPIA